ncbi:hypothetical protein VCR20J5_40019 [Vibrio crassostreae]|uniref:hypothetical protein n=1 Tax=Vibrio crassostreae TaxID=246167 RepID=UPI00063040CA|nr:hypothetical protein [Vibrio crassostreae]CDT49920.1 hypothetical protein VCR20J5_40019 [Vibrio crassostreae]
MTLPIFHSNNGTHSPSERLSELWKKIEKYERRNQKAELKVDQLFSEYEQKLAPYDKKLDHLQCIWVKHLMSFLTSKKLKTNLQSRLMQTIEQELLDALDRPFLNDRDKVEAVCEEYEAYQDKVFKKEKLQALNDASLNDTYRELENGLKDTFGADIELPEKEIRTILASEDPIAIDALIRTLWNSYAARNHNSLPPRDQIEDEWNDFEFDYIENEAYESLNIKEKFQGAQLSKMYKRIASVIHPDKEPEQSKKEEKHRLMQTLALAKQEQDVMTLVRMLIDYVPNSEHLLDDATLIKMGHLLEIKLRDLDQTHCDIFNQQGLKSHVWRRFSAPSKKQTQAKMEKYIEMIDNTMELMKKRTRKIKGINQLNKYLRTVTFH